MMRSAFMIAACMLQGERAEVGPADGKGRGRDDDCNSSLCYCALSMQPDCLPGRGGHNAAVQPGEEATLAEVQGVAGGVSDNCAGLLQRPAAGGSVAEQEGILLSGSVETACCGGAKKGVFANPSTATRIRWAPQLQTTEVARPLSSASAEKARLPSGRALLAPTCRMITPAQWSQIFSRYEGSGKRMNTEASPRDSAPAGDGSSRGWAVGSAAVRESTQHCQPRHGACSGGSLPCLHCPVGATVHKSAGEVPAAHPEPG